MYAEIWNMTTDIPGIINIDTVMKILKYHDSVKAGLKTTYHPQKYFKTVKK